MRTRKSLILILLCCLFIGHSIDCQDTSNQSTNKFAKLLAHKHADKTSKGKYRAIDFNVDDDDKNSSLDDDDDRPTFSRNEGRPDARSIGYRNNRAIDVSGSSEGNSGKNGNQSAPPNLPRKNHKPGASSRERTSQKPKILPSSDGICPDMDIRNNVNNFAMLKGCRVIEGFLQIVLIENNSEIDFQNITFPELREVTGYFLLYRVYNLKTLNGLFPNLEVIRGDVLLTDYSFMIYEMQNLQEIGLNKLIEISRGAVRIEKNPSLCYISTVDWDSIVAAGENFIKDNSKVSSCPVCSQCPGGRCWSARHCQKIQQSECHSQCLGECHGPTKVDCYVCKNYRHDGRCIASCPSHLYAYRSRRCITKEECYRMNEQQRRSTESWAKWRAFDGSCLPQCPVGFEDAIDANNRTMCQPCKGRCQKIGQSAIIRHISHAQSFRGTTVVKGSLEFQIRNGNPNIMNELTEAFGMVEEITGYLKVTHSFPITSLGFFKKLRVIKGEKLDINNASLIILDNTNLVELFPENQQIEIQSGRLFFHYNPKLCLSRIERLGKMVGILNFTDLEVQPESNGDKVACDIVDINISVKDLGSNYANVVWDVYKPTEGQRLLGYLLNYIETENENVSYEGNSCGRHNNNTWQIIDVAIPRNNNTVGNKVPQMLRDLKPFTKYAVYVSTLAGHNKNYFISPTGLSKIFFFRTQSDIPTVPTDVISFPVSDTEIVVKWGPPEHSNGPIHYYMISGFIRLETDELLESRDYCKYGLLPEVDSAPVIDVTERTVETDAKSCCSKDESMTSGIPTKFEIFCHENMTISYLSSGRKNYCFSQRYNVADDGFYGLADNFSSSRASTKDVHWSNARGEVIDDTKTRTRDGVYYSFVHNVSMDDRSYLLKKLRHYSLYTISVAACGQKLRNGTQMCSSIEYTNSRTKKRPHADDVSSVNVNVLNDTIVVISWKPPSDPNGITLAYVVEYTNLMVKDAKKNTVCMTGLEYREKRGRYLLRHLSPGKYSVRVRSTSLAGDGRFSDVLDFSVGIKDNDTMMLVLLPVFGFLLTAALVGYLIKRKYKRKKQHRRLIASVNPDYVEAKYVKDKWEVSSNNVEILEELGLGNFGMVHRGILDRTTEVAIKTLPKDATDVEKNDFLKEASIMKRFSTYHVIKLLGVVSEASSPYVIMELMEHGDLKSYLRKVRDTDLVPDVSRIIRMAGEIADGMAYLESRKFVHRDLAARNCMVSKDLVCKVGDFGMARDIYTTDYYKIGKNGLLPIRWMAPENLSDGVFTSDSDVWSYGIVLCEILTLGELPYQGFTNDEVLRYVLRRGTVDIPRNSPELLVKIMEKCYKWRPFERPTFMEIVSALEPFLSQDFCIKSFYHSEPAVRLRQLGLKKPYHYAATIRFHWGNETARWVKEFEDNVTLLDETITGTNRANIFRNGFQNFSNLTILEDAPLDR